MQRDLIGKIAITPLFEVEVPILPSEKADPEKGTGVLMCCTFGDQEDVEHWEREWPQKWVSAGRLPHRVVIGTDGRIIDFSGWFNALGRQTDYFDTSIIVSNPGAPLKPIEKRHRKDRKSVV